MNTNQQLENKIIDYLIANSPYIADELIEYDLSQLKSIAYSYCMPNIEAPKEIY